MRIIISIVFQIQSLKNLLLHRRHFLLVQFLLEFVAATSLEEWHDRRELCVLQGLLRLDDLDDLLDILFRNILAHLSHVF